MQIICIYIGIFYIVKSKVSNRSWGLPKGFLFNSYYIEVMENALLLSLDCSTTIDMYFITMNVNQGGIKYHFWVFGMTQPRIEPRSPGPLANTLSTWPMGWLHLAGPGWVFDSWFEERKARWGRRRRRNFVGERRSCPSHSTHAASSMFCFRFKSSAASVPSSATLAFSSFYTCCPSLLLEHFISHVCVKYTQVQTTEKV